jgi:hypothetical protein
MSWEQRQILPVSGPMKKASSETEKNRAVRGAVFYFPAIADNLQSGTASNQ